DPLVSAPDAQPVDDVVVVVGPLPEPLEVFTLAAAQARPGLLVTEQAGEFGKPGEQFVELLDEASLACLHPVGGGVQPTGIVRMPVEKAQPLVDRPRRQTHAVGQLEQFLVGVHAALLVRAQKSTRRGMPGAASSGASSCRPLRPARQSLRAGLSRAGMVPVYGRSPA